MEIRCCPEMSKDANGSTETVDIRPFLMQLDDNPMPYSAKALRMKEQDKITPKHMTAAFLPKKGGF